MKKDILNTREYEQIARLLSGEMNESEEKSFKNEIMTDPDKIQAFDEIEKNWNSIDEFEVFSQIDPGSAWQKVSDKLTKELVEQKAKTFPVWLKWAASWLLIIALGTSVWFMSKQFGADEKLYTLNTYDENITHVHTLFDGSIVYLGKNTSLSFPENFALKDRNVVVDGEAFFDVAHDPVKPFVIETNKAIVEVIGTSFNIKTIDENSMELFVENGKVKALLKEDLNNYLFVEHGELLVLQENKMAKAPAPSHYNTAWRKHHMHFKDERLENIVRVLNQNYQVTFEIEDEMLKDRRLTVTFYHDSYETIAELISITLNIDFELKGESSIIFKNKI